MLQNRRNIPTLDEIVRDKHGKQKKRDEKRRLTSLCKKGGKRGSNPLTEEETPPLLSSTRASRGEDADTSPLRGRKGRRVCTAEAVPIDPGSGGRRARAWSGLEKRTKGVIARREI